jgi:hypothetical protein
MKIYQIHEHSGEWEDYTNVILESYFDKDVAEARLSQLEDKERNKQRARTRCAECPVNSPDFEAYKSENDVEIAAKEYCVDIPQFKTSVYHCECENNEMYNYYDECTYTISEVEVLKDIPING